MDAERALIVQNLGLSWRYSIGNPYEEFSFPESLDEAQVLAELGFFPESRTTLQVSFTRKPRPYPSWTMGEKLLASAVYARLSGDRRFLARATPTLSGYVAALRRRQEGSGLLAPEHFSSDIPDAVQGLHAQAVAWQGLLAIASVWAGGGRPGYAAEARRVAGRLGSALRRAVASSSRRLPDGSLFLPMRLGAGEAPYGTRDRVARGQLLEPRRAVCPRIGPLPAGQPRRDGGARLPRASWLAAPRPRPCRRLLALRAGSEPTAVGNGRGVRGEPCALPGRSGRRGRARARSLRPAGRCDDAEHVRRRRGRERRPARRSPLPRDVPPAEQRRQRLVPGDTAPDARSGDGSRPAAGASRLRAPGCEPGGGSRSAASRRRSARSRTRSRRPLTRWPSHLEIPRGSGARTIQLRLRLPAGKRILGLSAPYRFDRATSTIELPSTGGSTRFRGADFVESLRWGGGQRSQRLSAALSCWPLPRRAPPVR